MAQDASLPLPQALGVDLPSHDGIFMNMHQRQQQQQEEEEEQQQEEQGGGGASGTRRIAQRRASTGTVMAATTEAETAPASSTKSSPSLRDEPASQPQPPQPHRRSMLAERRVSFSGTDRVREFNLGESERRMKIEAKRESKKARRQFKSQGERIDIGASADDIVPDGHPDQLAEEEEEEASASASASALGAAPLRPALRRSHSANDESQQQEYGDPSMFDDPFSAERVVSSLFTSLISTTSSAAAAAASTASEEPRRRSSHDGITTAMGMMDMGDENGEGEGADSSTSTANILAAARQRRRASIAEERSRRRSLDLWSAPAGTGRLTTSASTSAGSSTSAATPANANTTATATATARTQPTRTAQRRSSLELWSAPAKKRTPSSAAAPTGTAIDRSTPPTTLLRRASGDAIGIVGVGRNNSAAAPNNNNRLVEGLAQLRLMSGASRRLSPSGGVGNGASVSSGGAAVTRRRNSMMAAAPTTSGTTTFTVPLNDADGEKGSRRRSSTSASRRRHSLDALTRAADMTLGDEPTGIPFGDVEPAVGRFSTERGGAKDVVIINGKRIQRRTIARRRTSLEMEDEPNAGDVLDYMCEPQSSRSNLVLMDSETRRQGVKADAQRDRAARRRHSITLMPCDGWIDASYGETTFTNDTGTLGLRRTQSFDGSVLPSAILAKEMASEQDFSEGSYRRKGRDDFNAATVGTPDTELSSDEHALDGTSLHGDDDNSACRTASSSCVAVRRGSQERYLHKEDEASALPPLNITIHQRRRPSAEATAKADPRQRRSSDSDVARAPTRRSNADRTVDKLFTTKTSRPSTTGGTADPRRRSSREFPRRRPSRSAVEAGDANGSSVPQQEGRRARPNRVQRHSQQSQQQQQQQQHPSSALSGVYSQGRRRHSMGALNSFLTWHREEELPEGDSGGSTDAIAGAESTVDKLPKSNSLSDIQIGLAMELIKEKATK